MKTKPNDTSRRLAWLRAARKQWCSPSRVRRVREFTFNGPVGDPPKAPDGMPEIPINDEIRAGDYKRFSSIEDLIKGLDSDDE